jgi:hypothetical protein
MLTCKPASAQVLTSQGVTINNNNNPITNVYSPTVRPISNNDASTANAPGASAPGSSANPPSNAQAPGQSGVSSWAPLCDHVQCELPRNLLDCGDDCAALS